MSAPVDLVAGMVLETSQRWGELATEWQWQDAEAIFSQVGPRWHFLTRPRGGSKTTDLAGVALAWLALCAAPGERGYVVASDRDQAALLVDAAAGLVARTPALRAVLTVNAYKVTSPTGATLEVIPADGASLRSAAESRGAR